MQATRIFLGKNRHKTKDNHPDLILYAIDEAGQFIEVAGLWKAKSGNGYSGKINDNAKLEATKREKKDEIDKIFDPETGDDASADKF